MVRTPETNKQKKAFKDMKEASDESSKDLERLKE